MAIIEIEIQREQSAGTSAHEWRDEANCKGDTRLFFPPKAERPQARARREAKAQRLCDSLPGRRTVPRRSPGTTASTASGPASPKRTATCSASPCRRRSASAPAITAPPADSPDTASGEIMSTADSSSATAILSAG